LGASPSRIGLRSRVIAAKHAKREKKKEEDARETREKGTSRIFPYPFLASFRVFRAISLAAT
jgi:hypothetical protein